MITEVDDSRILDPSEKFEDIATYPNFAECVRHFEGEFKDYLTQLRQETTDLPEDRLEALYWAAGSKEVDAANPSIAIPLFLKRRGAPIEVTDTDEFFTVYTAPEISDAYKELWSLLFDNVARRLANEIARGGIDRLDAFPELAVPSIMEMPGGNREIVWAFQQGILHRAYLTSTIVKYLDCGADGSVLGSAENDIPLAEGLIVERGVLPLSLEAVLGMSEAVAGATLQEHPELVEKLGLDPDNLPKVDGDKLTYESGWFEAYWQPVMAKIDAEKQRWDDASESQ